MMDKESQIEQKIEHHNRIAREIGTQIIREFSNPEERIIVLESLITGIIGSLPYKDETARKEAVVWLLDEIRNRTLERIMKKPLKK